MTVSARASLWGALLITMVLAGLHLAAPRIRKLPLVPERATGSFAGGLAVAYVFLHLLPEIADGNEAIGEALSNVLQPSPLVDLGIFLVALAGFTTFYGLERLAGRHGDSGSDDITRPSLTSRTAPASGAAIVYWLHLSSFLVYNALITYTMPLRLRSGLAFAVLFTIAMGLHFVLTDRGLQNHYPRRFRRSGRLLLAAALLAGWVISASFIPSSTLLVALLTAWLGGSVLLNVFKEELPSDRSSSFAWFVAGLFLYAVLLSLITALGE